MTDAIIVDLDGTLCNIEHRRHLVTNGCNKWDEFFAGVKNDTVNTWCRDIANRYLTLFVSGRHENCLSDTTLWMNENKVFYSLRNIYMRKNNDYRPDQIIKEEIYLTHIKPHYNILFVIDDRKKVVDMWRKNGLTCLQCAEGDF